MFRRFGAQVTIVQQRPRLLSRVDDDVADQVAKIPTEGGIELILAGRR